MPNHERYIPALGLGILTPLFDPFLRYVLREAIFKHALIVRRRWIRSSVSSIWAVARAR